MTGWICVKGLRVQAIIGTQSHERVRRQELVIDFSIQLDLSVAAQTDRIGDTLDYKTLSQKVTQLVEGSSDLLMERLTKRILDLIMAQPRVERAVVQVSKPEALEDAESVSIRLESAAATNSIGEKYG